MPAARRPRSAKPTARISARSAPTPRQTATTYKVIKGDTLSSIAKRHAVEVTELREWNHLKNDRLKLGQVLLVSKR